jgi:hypothetical protein
MHHTLAAICAVLFILCLYAWISLDVAWAEDNIKLWTLSASSLLPGMSGNPGEPAIDPVKLKSVIKTEDTLSQIAKVGSGASLIGLAVSVLLE